MFIILDRDGVLNEESRFYIKTPDEWIPIPGSAEAVAKLNQAGHKVVIATNQSGVARGLFTEAMLGKIHDKLRAELAGAGAHVDDIFYCPHHPDDNCDCRKPKPGLLLQIAEKFNIDLTNNTVFIGDNKRDVEAAQAVNCKPILLRTSQVEMPDIETYTDLAEAVDAILK